MTNKIHIAIASTTSKPGQVDHNLNQIIRFARQAASDGAHLLFTAEMSASGYGSYPAVLAVAEVAGEGNIYHALARTAGETGVIIGAGFAELSERTPWPRYHISHYMIYPDGHFIVQRKHEVALAEAPMEPFAGAPEFPLFDICGYKCAILICADAGIPNVRALLHARGAQVVLLASASGGKREDRLTDEELKTEDGRRKYARQLEKVFFPGQEIIVECLNLNQAFASVSLCGFDGGTHYHPGHGMIINAYGEVSGFLPGQLNLDRQKPTYAHAELEFNPDRCNGNAIERSREWLCGIPADAGIQRFGSAQRTVP